MKIAAIDIGSNSIHMVIVHRHEDGRIETIDRAKEMVRLASGALEGRTEAASELHNRIIPDRFEAGLAALRKFSKLAERHGVDAMVAAATSAVREAENGGDFVGTVANETGIVIQVLPAQEEARLIYLAAREGVDLTGRRALFVDIGGGSVELTVGDARRAHMMESLKLGVIRLSERFLKSDPPTAREREALERFVDGELAGPLATARRLGFQLVVGSSGTILTLAAALAARRHGGKVPTTLEPFGAEELEPFALELASMNERDRAKVAGVGPRRASTIVAGALLLTRITKLAGARSVVPCDRALREGLVIDYLQRNSELVREIDQHRNPRERSVFELARRSGFDRTHARHVARLARELFDQLMPVHGLSPEDRELLEHAALLHDIGQSISFEDHHKHGDYLIRNGGLRGFDQEEIDVLALITRFHTKRPPKKKKDRRLAHLPRAARHTVVGLAAIVRIADALDRSHFQVIDRVSATIAGREVRLRVTAHGDAELELWAATRKADLIEEAYDVRVRFELEARPARERLAPPVRTPSERLPAMTTPAPSPLASPPAD